MSRPPARRRPQSSELVSLSERLSSLGLLRLATAGAALTIAGIEPRDRSFLGGLVLATAAYLGILATPLLAARLRHSRALLLIGLTLLVDGAYLAWAMYSTGGLDSPVRFLVLIHVVGVTLLASYRTGLKIAGWHALAFFVLSYAQGAELVRPARGVIPGLAGAVPDFQVAAMLFVGMIFGGAFVTGAFAALTERELRGQKIDLDQLAAMDAEIASADDGAAIASILAERLCAVFGATRAIVLASPRGDLEVMAYHPVEEVRSVAPGLDPVVEEAWQRRQTQVLRALDERSDPRLAALLPGARNVLVVPLFVEHWQQLGVLVLEIPGRSRTIKRWVVAMVERFAASAALAMRNVWLAEEVRLRLEENRSLRRQLIADNFVLEAHVQERTRELEAAIEDLRVVDDQRRKLVSRLVRSEEEARQQIAGEIHDDPVQKLAAASLRLQMLCDDARDGDQLEAFGKLLSVIKSCMDSLRHMLFELHPVELTTDGLTVALRQHAKMLDDRPPVEIDDRLEHQPDLKTRVVLYRIAQEALANVRKHAGDASVRIELAERDDGFLIRIADDGKGFSAPDVPLSKPGHLGLGAMRERAEMVGGWCNVFSLPGGGTTVESWIPSGAFSGDEGAGGAPGGASIGRGRGLQTRQKVGQAQIRK